MKPVGIVRQIDSLGRVLIPKSLRNTLDLKDGDSLELFIEDNNIILRKYQPACIICGSAKNIVTFKGHNFCPDCVREISAKLL
ncbi:MAG: AbrB/MazE/SpoVT family DNA-binding domain-containing protein [Clostridia bacterium]|nr:AbrB/MazE/SpoVT family DNA-binding domain-containing protein [Clostridia bacterium]